MKLEYGDVLFIKGSKNNQPLFERFSHWVICKVTGSPYYHVAFFMRDDLVFEADGFRTAGYARLDDYLFDVKRLTFSPEIRTKIMNQIVSTEGSKYDWGEILSLFLRKQLGINLFYDDKNKFICSGELLAAAYKVQGIYIVEGQATEDVCPGDLWNSPYLEEVK